ncbi:MULTISPECIES: hypothetical protein [Pseudomonas]|uniref:hypothetical protein n=1 Tax=Pseudomonas TaxID=286 RepID=UPI00070F2455|nr:MULTISPECIES: hypothetical protein [Pseudomonas]KQW19992.1 hypothetical protein ASC85_09155 [Pseudomonas sp. Root401]WHS57590.1 hypothetical protein QLH64_30015 [Pseudomonas brassicacearum]
MFSKATSKSELSEILLAKCEHAMFLDSTISTTYAAQPAPTKSKHRQRKARPDAYAQEVQRLLQAQETFSASPSKSQPDTSQEVDIGSLELEVAQFMRSRRRK